MSRTYQQVESDLEYYLGYRPSEDLVLEAQDYLAAGNHDLAAWVDALAEAGLL